jgi:hypothetical protein
VLLLVSPSPIHFCSFGDLSLLKASANSTHYGQQRVSQQSISGLASKLFLRALHTRTDQGIPSRKQIPVCTEADTFNLATKSRVAEIKAKRFGDGIPTCD